MKKIYNTPTTKVVMINYQYSLLSGSNNAVTFDGDGGSAELNEGNASGAALGRRGGLWDDEDFE